MKLEWSSVYSYNTNNVHQYFMLDRLIILIVDFETIYQTRNLMNVYEVTLRTTHAILDSLKWQGRQTEIVQNELCMTITSLNAI